MHKGLDSIGRGYGSPMSLALPTTFQSGVYPPNEPLPKAVVEDVASPSTLREDKREPIPKFSELVSQRYFAARTCTPERQKEKIELFERAQALAAEIDEFIEANDLEWKAATRKQHVEIRERGRTQLKLRAKLEQEFYDANAVWNGCMADSADARNGIILAQDKRKHLSRFASDEQIKAADEKVEESRARAHEVSKELAASFQARNSAAAAFEECQKELKEIALQELRLRAQLQGLVFREPTIGLEVSPA